MIDCRSAQTSSSISSSLLTAFRTKTNGYVASRMLEKVQEEERKREQEAKMNLIKKRRVMESNEDQPLLGRGLLPGNVIQLSEEEQRLSKIHALKERLKEAKIKEQQKTNQPQDNKISTVLKATGNSVFDALLQSSQSKEMKESALEKKSAYAEKAIQDRLNILKQREEMLERKEQAREQLMSLEISCFWCSNCRKFVENGDARAFCENQGHFLERRRAIKRMFECQECHNRSAFIGGEQPLMRCRCGGYIWKPCTFYKEKEVKMEELKITAPNIHVLYSHDIKT